MQSHIVHLVTTSKIAFWTEFQSHAADIFDTFGSDKFVLLDQRSFPI
jgi:hypothetical protein